MSAHRLLQTAAAATGVAGAVGLACVGYAATVGVRNFVVRHYDVPVLPKGADPLKVLHFSDLHLVPTQAKKLDWIRSLAALEPDLVIDTGDNLAHQGAVEPLIDALGPLLEVPGVFVMGSNDYFAPSLRNPVRYLLPDNGQRNTHTEQLPWRKLARQLGRHGWRDLTNTTGRFTVHGLDLAFVGVDDPHLEYDDLSAVHAPAPFDADLRIGVTHAPYLRVLDQFAADGNELLIAGHTHGGQLCLPSGRALVTNCDLEPARARGLHRHPADSTPADPGTSWLHVCAGAGTSPYAPVRFCCRPEAALLTLTPRA